MAQPNRQTNTAAADTPIDLWPTPAAWQALGRPARRYTRARGLSITPAGRRALGDRDMP